MYVGIWTYMTLTKRESAAKLFYNCIVFFGDDVFQLLTYQVISPTWTTWLDKPNDPLQKFTSTNSCSPWQIHNLFSYHYHRPQVTVGDVWAVQAEEWKFQLFWSMCLYSLFLFQLLVAHRILIELSFLLNKSLRSTTHKARQFGGFLKNSEVVAISRESVEMRSMLRLN